MAIAFGIRTAGGAYVFPVDIEDRLDDRERQILARIERLRALDRDAGRRPASLTVRPVPVRAPSRKGRSPRERRA